MIKVNIEEMIESYFLGKKLVDTDFTSKGDYEYYQSIGMDYPGFDGVIEHVYFGVSEDDPMITFTTSTGEVDVYLNDCITLEEV